MHRSASLCPISPGRLRAAWAAVIFLPAGLLPPPIGDTAFPAGHAVRSVSFPVRSEPALQRPPTDSPPAPSSDLVLTMGAAPDTAPPGSIVTYGIRLQNEGPSTAKSAVLTDTLPAATTFVSCAASGGGSCVGTGNARRVKFASLLPGAVVTVTLKVRIGSGVGVGQVVSNTARVRSRSFEPAPADNEATASVVVEGPRADLAVSMAAGRDTVVSGSEVIYNITVANLGPDAAGSVTLTDTLPDLEAFVSCASTGQGTCGRTGNAVTVSFTSLPAGSAEIVTLIARPTLPPPPYPASPVLSDAVFDLAALVRLAPGSDLWPLTWGPDDNLYAGWGDGGGFGGTNSDGRVSVGFARIAGFPPGIDGRNVWGGKDAPNPTTFTGKPTGMLSSDGVLHAWILAAGAAPVDVRLARSFDLSQTWLLEAWSFPGVVGGFYPLTFVNFGRDNVGARDDFVYLYGKKWSGGPDPYAGDDSHLARVPRAAVDDRAQYEFFRGTNDAGDPLWSSDFGEASPAISDPSGIDAPSVAYHYGLQRYLATTAHAQQAQKLSVFDAPEPWGPWTTVVYHENWGEWGASESLGYTLPAKWIDLGDGTLWMVFSAGGNSLDSFNLVPGALVLRPAGADPGVPGTRLENTARVGASAAADPVSANDAATAEITVVN